MAGPAAILLPILTSIGAPLLKRLITDRLPSGLAKDTSIAVVDAIADKLGVEPTPEAIEAVHKSNPELVADAVKEVEEEFVATLDRDALFAREDARETWFSWAWRPAMSWLLIWMWLWNSTLMPLLNAALKTTLPAVPYETLISYGGIWLVIYGGGHTIKSVFGK